MKVSGTAGWVGLTCYVVAWDYLMDDALSSAFKRSVRHPRRRWPVILVWGVTTLHLFDALPQRLDPFGRIAGRLGGRHLGASGLRRRELLKDNYTNVEVIHE